MVFYPIQVDNVNIISICSYKKFTKSKDLSRYGNTDLDSIFGKRKSVSAPVTPQVQSEVDLCCSGFISCKHCMIIIINSNTESM